jgi:hypothetical protein
MAVRRKRIAEMPSHPKERCSMDWEFQNTIAND